jgi:hypothetical protein
VKVTILDKTVGKFWSSGESFALALNSIDLETNAGVPGRLVIKNKPSPTDQEIESILGHWDFITMKVDYLLCVGTRTR